MPGGKWSRAGFRASTTLQTKSYIKVLCGFCLALGGEVITSRPPRYGISTSSEADVRGEADSSSGGPGAQPNTSHLHSSEPTKSGVLHHHKCRLLLRNCSFLRSNDPFPLAMYYLFHQVQHDKAKAAIRKIPTCLNPSAQHTFTGQVPPFSLVRFCVLAIHPLGLSPALYTTQAWEATPTIFMFSWAPMGLARGGRMRGRARGRTGGRRRRRRRIA